MTRDLRALPGSQVRIKLVAKFRDLLPDAFELRFGHWTVGELTQLFDVFLETLDR
jgi:hypothetical protein